MLEKIYSPVQEIQFSDHCFDVKRDDLIDPYISGNKWRKLKFLIAHARSTHKKHLVTFGGAYSNHLLATAAAAARFGFKTTAFVRGEPVNNEMLMLCRLYGMQLQFTSRESYKDKKQLFETHFASDESAFFIDEGGASEEATLGCAEIITELKQTYDHIFCAAGTGTTAAGLLKGIHQQQLKTQLHVIPVLKNGHFIADEILKYTGSVAQLNLHTDYDFGGYAKTTPALIQFIKTFTASTGLLIDPVYTGKAFYAVTDLLQKGFIEKSDRILVIHTGGLMGILGMKEKF